MRAEKNIPYLLVAPAIGYLLVLTIYPLIFSVYLSVHSWFLYKPKEMTFVGLGHFINLLIGGTESAYFWNALKVTLIFTIVTVSIEFFGGLVLALFLNKKIRGLNILKSIIILPIVIAPIAVGMLWRFMYWPEFGVFNYFLSLIHVPRQAWLMGPWLCMPSVIIVDIWQWTPFVALCILSGLGIIPQEPIEAAQLDGASGWQMLRYITLPFLKPIILTVVLLRIIDGFKIFDTVYALTEGGPGVATQTYSIYLFFTAWKRFDIGLAAAQSWFLLIICVVICTFFIRTMKYEEEYKRFEK